MGDTPEGPLLPDEFKTEWRDGRFWYREVCIVPDGMDAQKVASQTEYSLSSMVDEADVPEDTYFNIDIRRRPATREVVAEVEMIPGKPEGMPYAGMMMLCSEMMTQILGHDQAAFEGIIQSAIVAAGSGELKSMVMKDMFPDASMPDKD